MKKKYTIIIAVGLLIAVFLVGFLIVKAVFGKTYDFTIYSTDGVSCFTLRSICSSKTERNLGYNSYRADLVNADLFFEECVCNHPSFLYSVDDLNRQTIDETSNYLFFENNHYYYISIRDNTIYGAELLVSIPCGDLGDAFVSFPFIKDENHIRGGYGYLMNGFSDSFTWEDAPGIRSFDDLVMYYQKLSNFNFEQDAKNCTLLIPLQNWDEDLSLVSNSGKLRIQVTDNQILVNYLEKNG